MPRLYNMRESKETIPKGAKRIDRSNLFGNPFEIGRDGNRDQVCNKFEEWLATGESFGCINASDGRRQWIFAHLKELTGCDLICWCYPLRCHGTSLLTRANSL